MEKFQIFLSYTSKDKEIKDLVIDKVGSLFDDYSDDLDISFWDMETSGGEGWYLKESEAFMYNLLESKLCISIITDNTMEQNEFGFKRCVEEIKTVRDSNNKIGLIVLKVTENKLSFAFESHLGVYSSDWFINCGKEVSNSNIRDLKNKVRLFLDAELDGEKIIQVRSNLLHDQSVIEGDANFVGRSIDLKNIDNAFENDNIVVLYGDGGIGKTTLSKEYILTKNDEYNIKYLNTGEDGIFEYVYNIDFEESHGMYLDNPNERYQKNLGILRNQTEDAIFIIDGLDKDLSLDKHLKDLIGMKCKFLITSRIKPKNMCDVEIGSLSDDELIKLCFKRFPNICTFNGLNEEETIKALKELFEIVCHNTLTIDLAISVMSGIDNEGQYTIKELMNKLFVLSDTTNNKRFDKEDTINNHLINLFNLAKLSNEELNILKNLCLVKYSGLKKTIFKEILELNDYNVINDLIKKTIIKTNGNNIYLHKLISDLIFNNYDFGEEVDGYLAYLSDSFSIIMDSKIDNEDFEYIELLEMLIYDRGELLDYDSYLCYGSYLVSAYFAVGDIPSAIELIEQIDEFIGEDIFSCDINLIINLNVLKLKAYTLVSNTQKIEESYDILKNIDLDSEDLLLTSLVSLYMSYNEFFFSVGNFKEVLKLSYKIIDLYEQDEELKTITYGAHATVYIYIAGVLLNENKPQECIESVFKALSISQEYGGFIGMKTKDTAYTYLASAYNILGDYKEALYYVEEAFKAAEELYGDKIYTKLNYVDLFLTAGSIYTNNKDYEKALKYLDIGLSIYETNGYKDGLLYLGLKAKKADVYTFIDKYKALSIADEVSKVLDQSKDDNKRLYSEVCYMLYSVYSSLGYEKEAVKNLDASRKNNKEFSDELVKAKDELDYAIDNVKNRSESISSFEKALEIYKNKYGDIYSKEYFDACMRYANACTNIDNEYGYKLYKFIFQNNDELFKRLNITYMTFNFYLRYRDLAWACSDYNNVVLIQDLVIKSDIESFSNLSIIVQYYHYVEALYFINDYQKVFEYIDQYLIDATCKDFKQKKVINSIFIDSLEQLSNIDRIVIEKDMKIVLKTMILFDLKKDFQYYAEALVILNKNNLIDLELNLISIYINNIEDIYLSTKHTTALTSIFIYLDILNYKKDPRYVDEFFRLFVVVDNLRKEHNVDDLFNRICRMFIKFLRQVNDDNQKKDLCEKFIDVLNKSIYDYVPLFMDVYFIYIDACKNLKDFKTYCGVIDMLMNKSQKLNVNESTAYYHHKAIAYLFESRLVASRYNEASIFARNYFMLLNDFNLEDLYALQYVTSMFIKIAKEVDEEKVMEIYKLMYKFYKNHQKDDEFYNSVINFLENVLGNNS